MCSIVGYVGSHEGIAHIFQALRRLEYRGYDSAGCAAITGQTVTVQKTVGGVDELLDTWHNQQFDSTTCIGHTRWATHGKATYDNAHPHSNTDNTVAIVHNGIIDNERSIRQFLQTYGYTFHSQTDSELIAHLLALYLDSGHSAKHALLSAVDQLSGSFAICAITAHAPDTLLLARRGSPLCIGVRDAATMVASDVAGCSVLADTVIHMPHGSCAVVTRDAIDICDVTGAPISWHYTAIDHNWLDVGKAGYPHYMLKEIYEQKAVVRDTVRWLADRADTLPEYLGYTEEQMKQWRAITMVACGTSYYASSIGTYFFSDIVNIPAYAWIASEFRYRKHFLGADDCFMVLSQSGETADTLEALRYVKASSVPTIGVINVPESTIQREADGYVFTNARQEIAVASTKSFTTQVALLYWLAHYFGSLHSVCRQEDMSAVCDDVCHAAEQGERVLEQYRDTLYHDVAMQNATSSYCIFLGKNITYHLAQEAALKMKELAYIPSYAYPAGELKHGPLALIYEGTPVVLITSPEEHVYRKFIATVQEVKARGAHVIVFAFAHQHEIMQLADTVFVFPKASVFLTPLLMAPLLQAFAYYVARVRSCPIDKPRNLAKSVTVE